MTLAVVCLLVSLACLGVNLYVIRLRRRIGAPVGIARTILVGNVAVVALNAAVVLGVLILRRFP